MVLALLCPPFCQPWAGTNSQGKPQPLPRPFSFFSQLGACPPGWAGGRMVATAGQGRAWGKTGLQLLPPAPWHPWWLPGASLPTPMLFFFPFEMPATVHSSSGSHTKAPWIPASAPEACTLIQLPRGGFAPGFPLPSSLFLPPPSFLSFLDQKKSKDRHCDPQRRGDRINSLRGSSPSECNAEPFLPLRARVCGTGCVFFV